MSSRQPKKGKGPPVPEPPKKSVFDSLYDIDIHGDSSTATVQRLSDTDTSKKSRKSNESKIVKKSKPTKSKPPAKAKQKGKQKEPTPAAYVDATPPPPKQGSKSTIKPPPGDDDDGEIIELLEEKDTEEAIVEATAGFKRPTEKPDFSRLEKYIEIKPEKLKQKISRSKKALEGKLDAAFGPLDIMNKQKTAIIKAAVIRARRHERVYRKLACNWDSSSESEECIDCYVPKSVRKEQWKMHASYHHGIKRTSLFATMVKWVTVLIGLYDYLLTYYILFRIYTYQMWLTYFRAKKQLNCSDSIIEPYQIEVAYYCVNMINSVNLIFTLRRNKWKFLSYWLKTQLWLCILAPIPAFASARFNAKHGNVGSIVTTEVVFHCLMVVKVGIVLYRLYMVRKPFHWRRLNWFIKAERDRQLNQDLDARNSSFIQKKNSYRNAFTTALYSVIKTLVDHFETHGKQLSDEQVGEIIKKYDETLNDITMYPGIEQYLRMAYIRFCLKRGMKDQRILARQTQFFKLRDERMKRIAMEKIMEVKRRKRLQQEASIPEQIEILPT